MDGQWLFYRENASQWYDAWISAVDTMTIGGAVDTVKEITILAKNMSNDSFGFSKLCFSKDHGFVTACDLYMFPYREPGKQYKKGNDYFTDLLCEKVNNKPGPANMFFSLSNFDNPDMLEIFNYNVGDAFATSIFYDSYYSKGNYYTTLILTKDSTNPSEIKYVTRVWGTTYNPNAPGGYLHTEGNSSLTVGLELFIDTNQLPEEWGSRRSYYYYPNDTVMCTKGLYSTEATLMMYVDNNDSAIVRAFEPNRNTYQYKLGLGLLYRYRYYGSGNTFDVHYLTGTYKHGKICNKSPYLSIQAKNKLNMSIYPNPAHDYLTIQTDAKQYKVSIINSVGQVVRTIALSKEKETLYVGDLPNGIYNLRLVDADGVVNNYKLMVHH